MSNKIDIKTLEALRQDSHEAFEEVFITYYPQELELKANWDIEQDWDIYATPVDKQKPEKIKKNKPKEKKRNY